MPKDLKELVAAAGALSIARTLVQGAFSRSYGKHVTGKLAVNAKARGFECARAGGLADVWTALSRFEESAIRDAVIEALSVERFERAVTPALRASCLADAARFIAELSVEGVCA